MGLKIHQWQFGPMLNHQYLVVDEDAGLAAITDPGFDAEGIANAIEATGFTLDKILLTHTHRDHIGALHDLLAWRPVPVYVHEAEADRTKVGAALLRRCRDGDEIAVGDVRVRCLHTPGHTPGGQCFLIENYVITGDVLFIGSCGRTDLPGGDPRQLWRSLNEVLAALPDETVVLPGHHYAQPFVSTIGHEKRYNPTLRVPAADDFAAMMGQP